MLRKTQIVHNLIQDDPESIPITDCASTLKIFQYQNVSRQINQINILNPQINI